MHSKKILKAACIAAAAAVSLVTFDCANAAGPMVVPQQVAFDIKPQPLAAALNDFAVQSHQQILFTPEVAAGKTSPGIRGTTSPDAALAQILGGTGLVSSRSPDGMILVSDADAKEASAKSGPPPAPSGAINDPDRIRSTGPREQPIPSAGLEEIVVTAQKRVERSQDVPVPVTAISADALLANNQSRLQDYYAQVPGLSFSTGGTGDVELAIRGLTTGMNSNPSVGITIDDVPFGASTLISDVAAYLPDLDPSDLSRIEVLRGPQGTLYGASSIGGLLKFVTADPSTTELSGRVQADADWVAHGDGTGYAVRGAVNVPLSDTLAIRASGFTRVDPGYVNNIQTSQDGINRLDTSGGHFAALWRPSDAFSIKLGALLQNQRADGAPNVDPSLGDLNQSMLRGTGPYSVRLRLYTANLNAEVAGIKITSITGYGLNTVTTLADETPNYGGVGGLADQLYGVTGANGGDADITTRKLSQEIRISSSIGSQFDWLVGGFYTHESTNSDQFIDAANATSGASVGELGNFYFPSTFAETAVFADLTVHFTSAFDVQFGARESQNHQVYNETDSGLIIPIFFGAPSPFVYPTISSTSNAFTYLFTPRYKFSDDWMLYARVASGFRPGGPNADALLFGFPSKVGPDKAKNYEIGVKGETSDHRVSFDASVYYIDWLNLQIGLTDPTSGFVFLTNGGSAKSEGIELAIRARPIDGLTVSGWTSYNDAILTSNFPSGASAVGNDGDRLPYSSKFSATLSAAEEFPITGQLSGLLDAQVSYVGGRYGDFVASSFVGARPELPGYAKVDVRGGVRFGTWTVNLYANNVADRRGVISINPTIANPTIYIQPRMMGLSLVKTF